MRLPLFLLVTFSAAVILSACNNTTTSTRKYNDSTGGSSQDTLSFQRVNSLENRKDCLISNAGVTVALPTSVSKSRISDSTGGSSPDTLSAQREDKALIRKRDSLLRLKGLYNVKNRKQ